MQAHKTRTHTHLKHNRLRKQPVLDQLCRLPYSTHPPNAMTIARLHGRNARVHCGSQGPHVSSLHFSNVDAINTSVSFTLVDISTSITVTPGCYHPLSVWFKQEHFTHMKAPLPEPNERQRVRFYMRHHL